MTAPGEPAPQPRPYSVPPGVLDWQTHPAIGCNPMHIAMLSEGHTPKRSRKPSRSTNQPAKRSRKPAQPVTLAPATPAQPVSCGWSTLSLKR